MRNLTTRPFQALALAGLLATTAHGDFITGQVVDSNGVGVPGIDIDVDNRGSGGDPTIFNDGTDANGFFLTTVPAGIYTVIFRPPPPPVTTHLVECIENVLVLGTTQMGTITLPAGVSLAGRVLDQNAFPVFDVNLDVTDEVLGMPLQLVGGRTNAFGDFLIAVPANAIELRLDATPVLGQTLASQVMSLTPSANSTIPDVILAPGFTLTGTVTNAALVPLQQADIDVIDSASGNKVYVPRDSTDQFGNFSVVVAAGVYDVEVCPPTGLVLVALDVENLLVGAPLDLGSFALPGGQILSGTVTDATGNPLSNVDVDVSDSVTGASVVLCTDNTNGAGTYSVVVPNGTFDVVFSPRFSLPLSAAVVVGQVVGGATLLSATLPDCPFAKTIGKGRPGRGGIVPRLTSASGAPRADNTGWSFELDRALGGASGILLLSFVDSALPLLGGRTTFNTGRNSVAHIRSSVGGAPFFMLPLSFDGNGGVPGDGSLSVPLPVPPAFLIGQTLYGQFSVFDPAARGGAALSAGIQVSFCP